MKCKNFPFITITCNCIQYTVIQKTCHYKKCLKKSNQKSREKSQILYHDIIPASIIKTDLLHVQMKNQKI